MEETDMLKKTGVVKDLCKSKGIKCIYAPISFDPSSVDNPNKGLGILKGCSDGQLFLKDTWNTKIYEPLDPKDDKQVQEKPLLKVPAAEYVNNAHIKIIDNTSG